MIELSPEIITIVMLGGVLVLVMTGYPLSFAIGGVALIVGFLTLGDATPQIIYQRIYSLALNYTLAAVPLFIFMGAMLERSGIANKLFNALYLWLGGFRGGLAVSTVLIGTIVAACVGVVSASVSMLTLVALPAMIKRGYDKSLACGTCSVGGTLGILIPPSIMLVIYGPTALVSVGKLFMGAFFPGLLLSFLYCTYIAVRCFLQPQAGPAVPVDQRTTVSFAKKTRMLLTALLPTALIIMAVLGSIFMGIAPPTEAAAVGATATILLAIGYRKFSWQVLREVSILTLRVTSFAIFIAATSYAFVGIFLSLGCGEVLTNLVLGMEIGRWGIFGVIMFIIFILGFFIDWIGIIFIVIPIISPIALVLNFDPVWFGIMICINLQMSFNTPPLATALFMVKANAAPELGVSVGDVIKGVIPFVFLMMVSLVLCAVFPQIITWLPSKMIR